MADLYKQFFFGGITYLVGRIRFKLLFHGLWLSKQRICDDSPVFAVNHGGILGDGKALDPSQASNSSESDQSDVSWQRDLDFH